MPFRTRFYIYGVLAASAVVLAAALARWSPPHPFAWALYLILAVLASFVKLRLPGMRGTYSLNFLLLLYGIANFTLPETLVVGCLAALAQSAGNSRERPTLTQMLFNMANLTLSVAACFLVPRVAAAAGVRLYPPAATALVACVYFVVNTVLVSGALALLEGKPLRDVCRQWYEWPLPYFLVGAALVGLLPVPGGQVRAEAWLILLPLVYLVHFFVGLPGWRSGRSAGTDGGALPAAARAYAVAVSGAGLALLAAAAFRWDAPNPGRLAAYLALVAAASTLKVRLPRITGTISLNFVLLLVAIAEMTLPEVVSLAAVAGVVQCVWKSKVRPTAIQVMFNPACLAVSAAAAYMAARWGMEAWLDHSLIGVLAAATLVLYGCNTLMVAVVLCLIERKPLWEAWQHCYFWSFPYYLVGSAAAGLMVGTCRAAGWEPALVVLPVMALVFISYRLHVSQAVARQGYGTALPAAG